MAHKSQASLTSFFTLTKSPSKEEGPAKKKQKIEDGSAVAATTDETPPTEERNRKIALATKNLPQVERLLQYLIDPKWRELLASEFKKDYFIELVRFLESERASGNVYFPPEPEIFNAFNSCPFDRVKVVILGQDPYHGKGQAHGLSFSVRRGVRIPPSLSNIYRELASDLGPSRFQIPNHGNLESWCHQGVLLLNASLTVRANIANSHANKGWELFTDAAIRAINDHKKGVVFLLWGSYAQAKGKIINSKKHHVLKAAHPSPYSADKGFFGCRHFSKTNELLQLQGDSPINWNSLNEKMEENIRSENTTTTAATTPVAPENPPHQPNTTANTATPSRKRKRIEIASDDEGVEPPSNTSSSSAMAPAVSVSSSATIKSRKAEHQLENGATIAIYAGNVLTDDADVLIHPTDIHLDFSDEIIQKAGSKVQQECQAAIEARGGALSVGDVAVTSGGDLSFKKILHLALPAADAVDPKIYSVGLRASLAKANELNCGSVAVPEFADQNKVDGEMQASLVSAAALALQELGRSGSLVLRSVHFVLRDVGLADEFEKQLEKL